MWGPLWYIKCVLPVIALQTSTHMEGRVDEVVVSPTRTENASLPVPQRLGYRVPLQRSAKRGKMTAVFLAPPALTFPRVRLLQALKDHEAGARHGDVADATAAVRTVHLVFFHHTLHGKVTEKCSRYSAQLGMEQFHCPFGSRSGKEELSCRCKRAFVKPMQCHSQL